jgi:hypothetical protein
MRWFPLILKDVSMKMTRVLATSLGVFLLIINAGADSTNSIVSGTMEKTKTCFQCSGKAETKCSAPSCLNGQADCPAPCIKLNKGVWSKQPNRPDPNETMQLITVGGKRAYVSSHHPGVIYVRKADGSLDMQTCTVCKGTTRVACAVCKGKGLVVCPICTGRKVVPESWTAFDNPKMKSRPSHFKLKNGTVLVGRKVMAVGSSVTLRTEKGDVKVEAADIVEEEKQAAQK